jgi:hypothetical protein
MGEQSIWLNSPGSSIQAGGSFAASKGGFASARPRSWASLQVSKAHWAIG